MNAQTLVEQLQTAGFQLVASGEKLRVNPFSCLTPELRAKLKAHKSEIMLALRLCPFCNQQGARCERTLKAGLSYVETLCIACEEVIEIYVPCQQVQAHFEVVA